MVTWLLMHEHALSHIMLYDDSRITMRDAQVHVAPNFRKLRFAASLPLKDSGCSSCCRLGCSGVVDLPQVSKFYSTLPVLGS